MSDKELRLVESTLAKYERQAIRESERWMRGLHERLKQNVKTRRKVTAIPKIKEVETLKRTVSNLLYLAAITGIQRTKVASKDISIRLDTLSDTLRKIIERTKVSTLSELKDLYDVAGLETLAKIDDSVNNLLIPLVNDIVENKLGLRESLEILDEELERSGFSPRNSYTVENILRTQSAIVFNASKWREEQEIDSLWGYRYQTMEDDRVRDEHTVLNGVTLPKSHKFWDTFYPPNGWSCRCMAIPLFRKPRRVKRPPKGIRPDDGFGFNPGKIYK